MNSIEQHYVGGQHAAIRGLYRLLVSYPSEGHLDAWLAGYDSVPRELRGTASKTGPIDTETTAMKATRYGVA